MRLIRLWSISILMFLSVAGFAHATSFDFKKYSAGIQFADPAVGLSATVDVLERLSLQGIWGLQDSPTVAARFRAALIRQRFFDVYGYGIGGYTSRTDGAWFAGGGGGVEWDWRMIEPRLPSISWSLEAGYNYEEITAGFGVHYTF